MKHTIIIMAAVLLCVSGALAYSVISGPYASKEEATAAQQDPALYNNLGVNFAQAGKTTEAIAAFEHAIALNPDYEKARSNLATFSFQQGDYTTATTQLRWLVAHAPENGNYHFDLAQNLASQARYKDADLAKLAEAATEYDTAATLGVNHASDNAAIVRAVIAEVTA